MACFNVYDRVPAEGTVMLITGGFLSTMNPATGPAFAQLPARSQMLAELVVAFAVSAPARAFVESEKLALLAVARPDQASLAVHTTFTSAACHCPSGDP